MNDYYRVLEIEPNATQEQIKEQYRFLVQAWHPDRFGSPESKAKAEEKLKKINEAHDVLRDPVKRKQYDRERQYSKREHDYDAQKNPSAKVMKKREQGQKQRGVKENRLKPKNAKKKIEQKQRQKGIGKIKLRPKSENRKPRSSANQILQLLLL